MTSATESANPEFDAALRTIRGAGFDVNTVPPKATPGRRVIMWLVASVIAGLIPIAATAFHGLDSGSMGLYQLLGKGDLLIIAVVLSIAGVGEIALFFGRIKADSLALGLLIVGLIITLVVDSIWYSDLSALALDGKKGDPIAAVTFGSLALFLLAAIFSSYCVWLAAGAE